MRFSSYEIIKSILIEANPKIKPSKIVYLYLKYSPMFWKVNL